LTAGQGIERIKTVVDNAPNELKALTPSMKKIWVSETVYLQYIEDIEDGGGGDFGLQSMINGITNPTFRGIPVVPQWSWNNIYDTDLGNTLSHLIYYGTSRNNVVATDLLTDASTVSVKYSEDDENVKVKARFKLGGNYVHHRFMSVGY
jgi:hypothetical protein